MVLLHVKGVDAFHEFIYQCTTKEKLDDITRSLVIVHNLRVTLRVLCAEMKEFLQFGPLRIPDQVGWSSQQLKDTLTDVKVDDESIDTFDFDLDPNGRRVGVPITNEHVITTVNTLLQRVEDYINSERVKLRHKGVTTVSALEELMDELRGALMIAYPEELPSHEILQRILIDGESVDSVDGNFSKEMKDPDTAQLWFTSKKLLRSDVLSHYIGNNEKTKIVVKITKQKGNMPMREQPVDEEMRKKMMAYWHKKQEQEKALKEDDDTSYLQSEWANTGALKQAFLGTNSEPKYK